MISKKSWQDFRKTGLLFFINQILHAFGWAIVIKLKTSNKKQHEEKIIEVYPARVKFRGFNDKSIDEGYKKIAKYLRDNSDDLFAEIQ